MQSIKKIKTSWFKDFTLFITLKIHKKKKKQKKITKIMHTKN